MFILIDQMWQSFWTVFGDMWRRSQTRTQNTTRKNTPVNPASIEIQSSVSLIIPLQTQRRLSDLGYTALRIIQSQSAMHYWAQVTYGQFLPL